MRPLVWNIGRNSNFQRSCLSLQCCGVFVWLFSLLGFYVYLMQVIVFKASSV